jgi:hypothetical protein
MPQNRTRDNRTESDPSGLGTDELRKEIELPAWGDSEMYYRQGRLPWGQGSHLVGPNAPNQRRNE